MSSQVHDRELLRRGEDVLRLVRAGFSVLFSDPQYKHAARCAFDDLLCGIAQKHFREAAPSVRPHDHQTVLIAIDGTEDFVDG